MKMKALVSSALLLAGISLAALPAQAFLPIQVQTAFTPQQVMFQVENFYDYPIVCEGRFFAQTASAPYGIWMDFAIGPVVAGTWGYATMVAPDAPMGDYFIAVPQVLANCAYY